MQHNDAANSRLLLVRRELAELVACTVLEKEEEERGTAPPWPCTGGGAGLDSCKSDAEISIPWLSYTAGFLLLATDV